MYSHVIPTATRAWCFFLSCFWPLHWVLTFFIRNKRQCKVIFKGTVSRASWPGFESLLCQDQSLVILKKPLTMLCLFQLLFAGNILSPNLVSEMTFFKKSSPMVLRDNWVTQLCDSRWGLLCRCTQLVSHLKATGPDVLDDALPWLAVMPSGGCALSWDSPSEPLRRVSPCSVGCSQCSSWF